MIEMMKVKGQVTQKGTDLSVEIRTNSVKGHNWWNFLEAKSFDVITVPLNLQLHRSD